MPDFKEILQQDLEATLNKPKTLLVDVREVWEFADFNIGGINIPPHEITERLDELRDYDTIIVACSNGTRSSIVARLLTKKLSDKEILHLEEGIF
ncbi:rhodanese-like domain-containing protein [Emticicia sp. BO119]|uniref:rhodanese-like domain-containing protein n=1 Tax=Emticicia sp. BO119 TaxID=2757768 RepID=UPI0015F05B7C|nr:rhodanese-like domain-containing protein [Emticicia sp. BO119]MBA4852717.1 rhodanese-like domain-containing protein [Emticicia sp. BO119]